MLPGKPAQNINERAIESRAEARGRRTHCIDLCAAGLNCDRNFGKATRRATNARGVSIRLDAEDGRAILPIITDLTTAQDGGDVHRGILKAGSGRAAAAAPAYVLEENSTPVTRFGKMPACGMSALIDLGFIQ